MRTTDLKAGNEEVLDLESELEENMLECSSSGRSSSLMTTRSSIDNFVEIH